MESDTHTVIIPMEEGSSFDSISQPSDNSRPKEEAFVPVGSPGYMSDEFLDPIPCSQIFYGDTFWLFKKTLTPERCASVLGLGKSILALLTGRAPPKKLTPAEEEVEIRKSIVGAYRTIMMRKALTVSQLEDIWSRIKMLEEDMQESQYKLPLSSCSEYRQTVASLMTEFQSLLSFVASSLRGTCQSHALMREVDRGSGRDLQKRFLDLLLEVGGCIDLERAPIFTGSVGVHITSMIFDTENTTADGFLIGDAAIHPLHGNAAKTSKASFGIGSTKQTGDPSHPTLGGNRMSEQDVKLKSFDRFAQWATALFFAILIGLLAVNAKQAQFLFKSCSSLVFGATISGIIMLLLVLLGHPSGWVLSSLKILQYLIIGLLFITATQVYVFTLK